MANITPVVPIRSSISASGGEVPFHFASSHSLTNL